MSHAQDSSQPSVGASQETLKNSEFKVYLASPFFNDEQRATVTALESLIRELGFDMFSPRLGENAQRMNGRLRDGMRVPPELRQAVFDDNWRFIEHSDVVVANIDDFDVGVMWEIGYAYAKEVPVITTTAHHYGCNLMLAHSIVAHTKSLETLREALLKAVECKAVMKRKGLVEVLEKYARTKVSYVDYLDWLSPYKTLLALKEGPEERTHDV